MTAPALDFTQSAALAALRTGFLLPILPSGVEVVLGQDNRVPPPKGTNFLVMTPLFRARISTNVDTYSDGYPSSPSVKNALQPTKLTVQVDVIGPDSADHAQRIATLWRDEYATDALNAKNVRIQPLYCEDPKQIPWTSGEQQVDQRWEIDLHIQINPTVTLPQDFADKIVTKTIQADQDGQAVLVP